MRCENKTGDCLGCNQGYQLQNKKKDCNFQQEKLNLDSVIFDCLKTTLKVKFDSEIKLSRVDQIVVMVTLKVGSSVKVKVESVRSSR